jgi:hypothetical protein
MDAGSIPDSTDVPAAAVMTATAPGGCVSCGQPLSGTAVGPGFSVAHGPFVYAIGRLVPQFPSPDVQQEFVQLAADLESAEVSEHHRLKAVLAKEENLYLAQHICWVFNTRGVDSFAVVPRDNDDARLLVEAFTPASDERVINVLVGRPASTPPAWDPTSTTLPLTTADQLLTFTLDEFLEALSASKAGTRKAEAAGHTEAFRELFLRLTQSTDNHGAADVHRARNYVALRYPAVYRTAEQAYDTGKDFMGVEARPAQSSDRRLVSVRLIFRDHHTQILERYSCTVDVTGEFCYLATPLSPTWD